MIRKYLAAYREYRAVRKLQRMIEERRNSYEIQDYCKRRAAMLRHTRGAA